MRLYHHQDPRDLVPDPRDRCEVCVTRRLKIKFNLTGMCLECLNRRLEAVDPNESFAVVCQPKQPASIDPFHQIQKVAGLDRLIPPAPKGSGLDRLIPPAPKGSGLDREQQI